MSVRPCSLRFAVLPAPRGSRQALLPVLRGRGHDISAQRSLRHCLRACADFDAVLAWDGSLPDAYPHGADAAAVDLPCVVLVGAHAAPPAWVGRADVLVELLADAPDPLALDVFLHRLQWRRQARSVLAQDAARLRALELQLAAATTQSQALGHRISHAAQAALRYIGDFTQRLERTASPRLDDGELTVLRFIRESAQRAHGEIQALMVLAEVRQAQLEPVYLDLAQLVASCIAELGERGAHVAWTGLHDLPGVTADEALLRLALGHLLANAAAATRGRPGPWVEIGAMREADGVRIDVRDNGIGFPASAAHRLFQPFERLHARGPFTGLGMGLALVAAVAERHGGRVEANAPTQGGAIFSLWLAVDGAASVAAPAPLAPATPQAPAPQASPPAARVLLVDDDALVLATLRRMVLREGHQVWTASSGEAALAQLAALDAGVDVLVVDWSMPGLDGVQVAVEARQRHPRLRTVLLTGHWGARQQGGAPPPGVDHVLGKPVTQAALRAALHDHGGAGGEAGEAGALVPGGSA